MTIDNELGQHMVKFLPGSSASSTTKKLEKIEAVGTKGFGYTINARRKICVRILRLWRKTLPWRRHHGRHPFVELDLNKKESKCLVIAMFKQLQSIADTGGPQNSFWQVIGKFLQLPQLAFPAASCRLLLD